MWDWNTKFIFFTASLAFLFGVGDFIRSPKSQTSQIQVVLFFLAGIFQTHTYLTATKYYVHFPNLFLVHLPFTALFGPFLKRYFSELWEDQNKDIRFRIWDWLPAILVFLILLNFYTSSSQTKVEIFLSYNEKGVPLSFKLAICVAVIPILYSGFYVFRQINRYTRKEVFQTSAHLRLVTLVVGFGIFASLVGLYTLFFHSAHGLEIVSTIIGFLLVWIYLLRQKSPELWGEVKEIIIAEKKYQSNQLKQFDLNFLTERLTNLMESKKIYRDEDLNLAKLAKQMDLSEHQLSEFLNQHMGKNFFHFINHYRITEAKEICAKEPTKNILNIALEVGFPSKSTFYDAFKREVGISPTEYRKQQKLTQTPKTK